MSGLRLRHVAAVNPAIPGWESIADDEPLTFLPLEAVWPGRMDYSILRAKAEVSTGYTRFTEGDVIVPKITPTFEADRSTVVSGMPTSVGTGTTELHVIRPSSLIDARYVKYLVSTRPFLRGGEAEMIGVAGQKRVPDTWLRNCPVPVAAIETQRIIADFLDRETARIDALITAKRRMIELLGERRVGHATSVTAGQDGSLQTGIPSLPTIPGSWRVLRNKVFMREVADLSSTGNEEMLSVSHLTGVTPRAEKTVYMFEAETTVGHKVVRPGDLVINTMWAWMGAAGVASVPGMVSPAYGVYRIDPEVMLPQYLDIMIRTPAYVAEMTRYSRGVTSSRLRLYPEEFLALSSTVPPLTEQHRTVSEFTRSDEHSKNMSRVLLTQNDLLVEHRQALITAAVTGELDLEGAAA